MVLYGERMTHASDTAGPSIRDQVSEEIRVLMARHKWTGRKLATVTGIHEATLSRRLSGEYTFTLDELDLIAGALGVPITALFPQHRGPGGGRARQDSNLRPEDYKSPTSVIIDLAAERARRRTNTRDVELPHVAKVLQVPSRMLAAA